MHRFGLVMICLHMATVLYGLIRGGIRLTPDSGRRGRRQQKLPPTALQACMAECGINESPHLRNRAIISAAVAGGIVGAVAMGPVVAIAAAGGAAYAATRKDKIGEAAVLTGLITCAIRDTAVDINREHDITGKLLTFAGQALSAAAARVEEAVEWYSTPRIAKGSHPAGDNCEQMSEQCVRSADGSPSSGRHPVGRPRPFRTLWHTLAEGCSTEEEVRAFFKRR